MAAETVLPLGDLGKVGTPADGLPRLWSGDRRRHLTLLVASGLAQALAAGTGAHFLGHVLGLARPARRGELFAVLVLVALAVGALRAAERILSERLSQDYVHEVRLGLVRANLSGRTSPSLGIAVARATNDLTSVKTWVSQGVAPLAVGVPLLAGAAVVLWLLAPVLVVGLLVPVAGLAVVLVTVSPYAYRRARALRKVRGRLSSYVADTLLATRAIRSAGGQRRELGRIEEQSLALVAAAVSRARTAGALRGAAAATSGLATASMVGLGIVTGVPTATVASALTVLGFLAAPIHDLGRVVEYRQTFRAARRILGPALERPVPDLPVPLRLVGAPAGGLTVEPLRLSDGASLAPLAVPTGARVLLETGSEHRTSEVLDLLAGLRAVAAGTIVLEGRDLGAATPTQRRALVGLAGRGMRLPRGSVSRALRYRWPDATEDDLGHLLATVGLAERVVALPKGTATQLRHGGEPLSSSERARLLMARALLRGPSLLLLDHLDSDLDPDGRVLLQELLGAYPGTVVMATERPEILQPTHVWTLRPE